jgi:hypothetical protein
VELSQALYIQIFLLLLMRYAELLSHFRKGMRNGNWRRLNYLEKGLYRTVLFYTRVRGEIVNAKLAVMIRGIVAKLTETRGLRILKAGHEEAKRMFSTCSENGVFEWCPELKEWLREPDYVFWLGASTARGMRYPRRSPARRRS